jgi:hypothetical protein
MANSNIQAAFAEAGWIQVQSVFDDNIPVFFRLCDHFHPNPFDVITTVDGYGYYKIYDEWIKDGLMPPSGLTSVTVDNLIRAAFEHYRAAAKVLHAVIYVALKDYYWIHREFSKSEYYRLLAVEHVKQHKNATATEQSIR